MNLDPHMFGSIPYTALNAQLWEWKAKGLIDSILVNPFPHPSHAHIANILGFENIRDMIEHWSDESTHTLKLLCGPHGFTIYKMLVIKWEAKVNGTNEESTTI